jgi:hypothetical protein
MGDGQWTEVQATRGVRRWVWSEPNGVVVLECRPGLPYPWAVYVDRLAGRGHDAGEALRHASRPLPLPEVSVVEAVQEQVNMWAGDDG